LSPAPSLSIAPSLSPTLSAAPTAVPVVDSSSITINVFAIAEYEDYIRLELWNIDLEELIFDSYESDYVFEEGLNSIYIDSLSCGLHEVKVVDLFGVPDDESFDSYVSITSGSTSGASDSSLIYISGKPYQTSSSRKFEIVLSTCEGGGG